MRTQYVEIWGIERSLAFPATHTVSSRLSKLTSSSRSSVPLNHNDTLLLALALALERAGIRSTALPFVYTFSFGAFAGCTELMLLFPLGKHPISAPMCRPDPVLNSQPDSLIRGGHDRHGQDPDAT